MKKIKHGIYLAYAPTVDLRHEGLGRYLLELIKGSQCRDDIQIVIACPAWLVPSLHDLFADAQISPASVEWLTTKSKPALLKLHSMYLTFKNRRARPRAQGLLTKFIRELVEWSKQQAFELLTTIKSLPLLLLIVLLAIPITVPFALFYITFKLLSRLREIYQQHIKPRVARRIASSPILKLLDWRTVLFDQTGDKPSFTTKLFRLMEAREGYALTEQINQRTDIAAWYSPTAFWPQFNRIRAPRVMCVPDVVLGEFPTGFSSVGGEQFMHAYREIERSIDGGDRFVVYSESVKWETLVNRFNVDDERIHVIPHGVNRLDQLVTIQDVIGHQEATERFCRTLFSSALRKAIGTPLSPLYSSAQFKFIFFASQFRPNKNLVNLLKAYRHLLRSAYLPHKLVLTGNPMSFYKVREYIYTNDLDNDVLCLHGLSSRELAACYRLADLAVSPSLSEGGCPFTLTEAMSVGTPALLARIPVAEEIITDPAIQDTCLFDPYDWQDMANKIKWALGNLELLREIQTPLYNKLAQRTWATVSGEYIALMESIAQAPAISTTESKG